MAIATTNPATGEVLATFDAHGPAEIEARLARAEAAFDELRGTDFAQRGAWMRAAADLLERRPSTRPG